MTPRRRRLALAGSGGFVAVLVAIALLGGGPTREPIELEPTTTRADLSGVELRSVEGTTTTTRPESAGEVAFRGTVKAPGGKGVPGATVRAEWFRVDPPEVIEVFTDEEGRYEITGVAGGRWQVRAWRTPDFATSSVQKLFVNKDEERTLDLDVREVEPFAVTWDVEPDPPITNRNTEFTAVFSERTVDVEGRTVTTPAADIDVTLITDRGWQRVRGDATVSTSSNGQVVWILRCRGDGRHRAALRSIFGTHGLSLPPCIPITATSTTTTEAPDTTTTDAA